MMNYEILGCTLIGGGVCPEQYDVYIGPEQIGYLRLRHGAFRADYGDVGGETVYYANPRGDGSFYDEERKHYLTEAVKALLDKRKEGV